VILVLGGDAIERAEIAFLCGAAAAAAWMAVTAARSLRLLDDRVVGPIT
jgi:hypothetical protein